MERLTTNKPVSEMSMLELALNCCYVKDGLARYRDFEKDFDSRDLVRQLMVVYGKWKSISQDGLEANNELIDDEIFDDTMLENLMCPPMDLEGFIALFYRNMCAMSELRERLKAYEDAEEQGLLHRTQIAIEQVVYTNFAMSGWYLRDKDRPYKAKVVFIGLNDSEEMGGGFFNIAYEKLGCMMQFRFSDIGKSVFLTKEEAEQKLAEMKRE